MALFPLASLCRYSAQPSGQRQNYLLRAQPQHQHLSLKDVDVCECECMCVCEHVCVCMCICVCVHVLFKCLLDNVENQQISIYLLYWYLVQQSNASLL